VARITKKIDGNKHSVVRQLEPLIHTLDATFGEQNVLIGEFYHVRTSDKKICMRIRGYDSARGVYKIQARKGGMAQNFYIRMSQGDVPPLEEFVRLYTGNG
jgi:hypothetical protein